MLYVWSVRALSCKPNIYVSWSTSKLRVRLARLDTGLSPPVTYFTDRSKAALLLWIIYVFSVLSCASVYWSFVVTCWERAGLLVLVCNVYLWSCHFLICILVQVWCLIVSIPDLCRFSNFQCNSILELFLVFFNWCLKELMESQDFTSPGKLFHPLIAVGRKEW